MRRFRSVTVSVDVDMADIDTDDLVEELQSRGRVTTVKGSGEVSMIPALNGEETHPLHEIYYAFKFGLDERAAELARAYVCDELGVVL